MSEWMKVCKCGDYKEQHENGAGPSNLFALFGEPRCPKYRFSHHEEKLTYEEFKAAKKETGFMLKRKI